MKMFVRRTALAVCILVLAVTLSTAASAACTGFDNVPESADCYESVMYLAGHEIAAGTGNDCFSPEQLITVEQWAVMLCRAYGAETIGDSWQDVGRSSVVEAYRQGWLNETALSAPRSPMCRSVLVESAFAAADVPVYLEDGRLELSNNRAERSIKPFVMGRKNWLFANTPGGAQASAVIYSLIETAKENGLDPYRYLLWVLQNAPQLSETNKAWAESLLPANAPEECYMSHK